jgi:hypothetical protein
MPHDVEMPAPERTMMFRAFRKRSSAWEMVERWERRSRRRRIRERASLVNDRR